MTMITHTEQQGTSAWKGLRASHDTASEAPAMLGDSKYQSRDELMSQKKYGAEKEITPHLQKLFDKGHATEASIRPVIEKLIGKDLYPVTGSIEVDGLKLLASFDGLTMLEDVVFEHKLWGEALAQTVRDNDLAPNYYWQLEQQLLVSGAEKAIFVVSDGTEENMEYCWYEPVPGRAEQLIAGWKQFAIDLESHEHVEAEVKPVSEIVDNLPSVSISVDGGIAIIDNLSVFGKALNGYVEQINKEPETDQDFANLESAVKTLAKAESALDIAENGALSQAESIDEMRKHVELYRSLARDNRLVIEKLIKAKKASIKADIVSGGTEALNAHIRSLSEGLENYMPSVLGEFASVIKGKRTMTSIRGAVNDELARCKILANEFAETMRTNLKLIDDNSEFRFLFNDLGSIVGKDSADFKLLADSRINEHKEKLAEKERVRIADEERVRIAKEAADNAKAVEAEPVKEELVAEAKDIGGEECESPNDTSKAYNKKRQPDINKLKKYVARLNDYKVPALEDSQCIDICAKITEQLMTYQERLNNLFPETTEDK